jgi:hypothetical protein
VVKHQAIVRYRRLELRWGAPLAAGADSVVVLQSGSPSKPPTREIYRGHGTHFVISGFENGVYPGTGSSPRTGPGTARRRWTWS